ncbi:hypothetical protein TNCV_1033161 [Trichonephila clavipes]|nr:hypothetical protein TNCV_1033161 [Trichonephila clavipes]
MLKERRESSTEDSVNPINQISRQCTPPNRFAPETSLLTEIFSSSQLRKRRWRVRRDEGIRRKKYKKSPEDDSRRKKIDPHLKTELFHNCF